MAALMQPNKATGRLARYPPRVPTSRRYASRNRSAPWSAHAHVRPTHSRKRSSNSDRAACLITFREGVFATVTTTCACVNRVLACSSHRGNLMKSTYPNPKSSACCTNRTMRHPQQTAHARHNIMSKQKRRTVYIIPGPRQRYWHAQSAFVEPRRSVPYNHIGIRQRLDIDM